MAANVETMFSVRETPWHGLGRIIMDAPASREALELAGLDWQVESRNIYSGTGAMIPGYRANVRSTDDAVLGVVSDRYRMNRQNHSEPENKLTPEEQQEFLELLARLSSEQREALKEVLKSFT